MLPLRNAIATMVPAPDRFRGTTQRCRVETGPRAGTTFDQAFHADWSVAWRVVAGAEQGRVGRSREFCVQQVRAELYLLAYELAERDTLTMTLDFSTRRFVGYNIRGDRLQPVGGSFQTL